MKISIILPTLKRPNQLIRSLKNISDTVEFHKDNQVEVETIVIVDEQDLETKLVLKGLQEEPYLKNITWIVAKGSPSPVEKWNLGARRATGDWFLLGSDDYMMPPNWVNNILATENKGFIAVPDQNPDKEFEPFFLVSRKWLKLHQGGVLVVPHYFNWGCDLEICERAKKLGHYVVAKIQFFHMHVLFKTANNDSTYERSKAHYNHDLETFKKREAQGFPDDFKGYL